MEDDLIELLNELKEILGDDVIAIPLSELEHIEETLH